CVVQLLSSILHSFIVPCSLPLCLLHSFPTRRSSDLPRLRNLDGAPIAPVKISRRFFHRLHRLRPDRRDECAVLHAHHAEFLLDRFPFFSNRPGVTKLVASNHATLPPA